MSDLPPYAINRRAGKTIFLNESGAPPIDGTGTAGVHFKWFVAPDADESFPRHFKSTDRDDTILITGKNWYNTISIDGGDGVNVIQGTFGSHTYQGVFTPDVSNVQWALLSSEAPDLALNLSNWRGLTYVEARGENGSFSTTSNKKTRFINIPLAVKQIGVANFNGIAVFEFAPPPPNSVAFHPVDLFLDSNSIGGEIYVDSTSALHIHATGYNGPQILHAGSTGLITVGGRGDAELHHSSSLATTIDASAATGSLTLTALSPLGVKITAGRGYLNAVTTNGNHNDTIDFLKNHLGHSTYIPLSVSRLIPAFTGINMTDVGLDALAIKINNFIPTQDKIDLRKSLLSPYALAITHENLDGQGSVRAAAETAAAHNAHLGHSTLNVFQYKGSTYVFFDYSGDQKLDMGDGLIKLVGVSSRGPNDFVTADEFIIS